jgi:hypothetical protein
MITPNMIMIILRNGEKNKKIDPLEMKRKTKKSMMKTQQANSLNNLRDQMEKIKLK